MVTVPATAARQGRRSPPVLEVDGDPSFTEGAWYGMCMFSERTQVLLSPEQLERVKRIARREGTSVGAVIRDAVDAFTWSAADRRQEAFEHMLSMDDGTADDWEVMKAQIVESRYPPVPE
jgi:hypothetical protein